MSESAGTTPRSFDVDRVAPEAGPGLRLLPVVHERVEMAAVARATLDRLDPAAVAVELPTSLLPAALAAVARLPRLSVVLSQEDDEDEALVWIVAPGDPIAEAVRWAGERGRPVFAVDPDLPFPHRHHAPVPDPYALWSLDAHAFLTAVRARTLAGAARDEQREAGMAFHLLAAHATIAGAPLLALLGAAHVSAVARRMGGPLAHPLARVTRSSVEVRHLHPESPSGLLPDAPLAHAVWELVRGGELPAEPSPAATVARPESLVRFGLRVIRGQGPEETRARERARAARAARASARPLAGNVLCPDRRALGGIVWRIAAASYHEQTGEEVGPAERRVFFDFAHRYARLEGLLAAGLYEWIVAARGVADDNLAWETLSVGRCYPWQEELAEIPTARLDGDALDLGSRRVRFRRRFFRVKRRSVPVAVRSRPHASPDEWLRGFTGRGLCSWPQEDLVVEDYGRFLKHRAVSVLSAERQRTAPFTVSLCDGIDLAETLRHFEEERVYVREMGRAPGQAGSVVVVFDRDRGDERFPFRMTWLGEHDQESDMAFYSTRPEDQVVGPGILRATYGGFLLSYPPGRLIDVWADPDYTFAEEKAEVLLAAAVDYSPEKIVVYVAAQPPGDRLRRFAAARGKRIVHLPIGSLSPRSLKRIRAVHLLAGRDKRAIAKDYIW